MNNQCGELTVLPEETLSSNELVEVNGFVPAFIKAFNASSAKVCRVHAVVVCCNSMCPETVYT